MVPHVVSKSIFSVKSLHTKVTFIESLSVSPHVPQQDKSSGELLVTDGALEGLLSRVVSYVIIENVSSVECFSTVSAFEFLPIIIQ